MNSRRAALVTRSSFMRQLPRRSRDSQPYTAGTFGHFAMARATTGSMPYSLLGERVYRMGLIDTEALGVAHAHRFQAHEDVLLFDAFGDHAEPPALPHAQDGVQLAAGAVIGDHLARDASVHFHELHAERLQRRKRDGAGTEAIDQQRRADRLHH